jgi:hypothetical protein
MFDDAKPQAKEEQLQTTELEDDALDGVTGGSLANSAGVYDNSAGPSFQVT